VFTAEIRGRGGGGGNHPESPAHQITLKLPAQAFDHISATAAIFQEDSTNMDDSLFWRVVW